MSEIEFSPPELKGVDWRNDELFFTHSWTDETSQFDRHPSAHWNYGAECYEREYKARVPLAFKDCDELIDKFLCMMMDDYPDCEGFWID